MIEQRKNLRFDLRLPLEIVRNGAVPKTVGETMNVSSSGVLFTAEARVNIGQSIEYMITLPKAPSARGEVRLRCVGKVVREDHAAFAATLERYEFVRNSEAR